MQAHTISDNIQAVFCLDAVSRRTPDVQSHLHFLLLAFIIFKCGSGSHIARISCILDCLCSGVMILHYSEYIPRYDLEISVSWTNIVFSELQVTRDKSWRRMRQSCSNAPIARFSAAPLQTFTTTWASLAILAWLFWESPWSSSSASLIQGRWWQGVAQKCSTGSRGKKWVKSFIFTCNLNWYLQSVKLK